MSQYSFIKTKNSAKYCMSAELNYLLYDKLLEVVEEDLILILVDFQFELNSVVAVGAFNNLA